MRRSLMIAALVAFAPLVARADTQEIEMPADPDLEAAAAAKTPPPPEPPPAPAPPPKRRWIEPYGAIAGGVELESLHQPANVQAQTQNPTVAITRIGIRGGIGRYISYASEIEASIGGPLGYGASVWEGQAALAIWDQYIRYTRAGWSIAAGRITDAASIDYTSEHVADLLLADMFTRDPLLYSGADRGNGIQASYDLGSHVTAGLTLHSTNPTGITGTLIIGGKLTPFDRPFYLAAAAVGNNANNLPDQNLHIYFGSPSLVLRFDRFELKSEVQMYSLDTQVAVMDAQPIRGYNLRLAAKTWADVGAGRVVAFANVSRNKNEILDPTTSKYRLPGLFQSYTVSAGVDWDYKKRNGIGVQYAMVDTEEPGQHVRMHYLNVGTSYWIEDALAIGVRGAVFAQQISGEAMTTGERALFVTARLVLR
jgi:hypothetical protein